MKKCIRCQLIFHSSNRLHCLYCDSLLVDSDMEEVLQLSAEKSFEEKMAKAEPLSHERIQFLVGSFFKTKSFTFKYQFNRNQFKMSKAFPRAFIEPLDISFFIKIPWFFVDIFDSWILRLTYTGYCSQCNWKYQKLSEQQEHTQRDCEYNKEYNDVLNGILDGQIARNEVRLEKEAARKIQNGQKSAYHDLCVRRKQFESFVDILTILLSMGLMALLLIKLTMPIFGKIYDF